MLTVCNFYFRTKAKNAGRFKQSFNTGKKKFRKTVDK